MGYHVVNTRQHGCWQATRRSECSGSRRAVSESRLQNPKPCRATGAGAPVHSLSKLWVQSRPSVRGQYGDGTCICRSVDHKRRLDMLSLQALAAASLSSCGGPEHASRHAAPEQAPVCHTMCSCMLFLISCTCMNSPPLPLPTMAPAKSRGPAG